MFLNLLYKSLKADIVLRRVKAFVKRLLQVSCDQKPTFACGALYLVSEVMKAKPGLKLLLDEGVSCLSYLFIYCLFVCLIIFWLSVLSLLIRQCGSGQELWNWCVCVIFIYFFNFFLWTG